MCPHCKTCGYQNCSYSAAFVTPGAGFASSKLFWPSSPPPSALACLFPRSFCCPPADSANFIQHKQTGFFTVAFVAPATGFAIRQAMLGSSSLCRVPSLHILDKPTQMHTWALHHHPHTSHMWSPCLLCVAHPVLRPSLHYACIC